MSSAFHFSPAFKPSISGIRSFPSKLSKKRKRSLEWLEDTGSDGGKEGFNANSTATRTGLPSDNANTFITTSLVVPDVETSCGHKEVHSQLSQSSNNNKGPHVINGPRSFQRHITETAPPIAKGQISDELATLKPPLYIATGRLPTASAEKPTSSTGLRQHHFKTITAVLHRSLLKSDYIRAGRAWAMLLRAEQHGQSMDLRTSDHWGIGAEILMQRESQIAQKTLDHKVGEALTSHFNPRIQPESIEKAKEYYERVVLQYPYRKAFTHASGALNFSIAMFSLWVYTVKEERPLASTSVGSFNEDIDEAEAEANDDFQTLSAPEIEPHRYQKNKNVNRYSLKAAYEIAARLDGLLVSPPFSDNAKLWKLCGEVSQWIADLLVPTNAPNYDSNVRGNDADLAMKNSTISRTTSRNTPLSNEYKAGHERQKALAKAEEAFQRVKSCGESLAE